MDGSKQWSAVIVESTFIVDFDNQSYSDSLRFFKSFHSLRFRKIAVTVCVFPGYVSTLNVKAKNVCGYERIWIRVDEL